MPIKRRKFIRQSSLLAASSIMMAGILKAKEKSKSRWPNEKIKIGVIGCNGMGWYNVMSHLQMEEVECVAICDVDNKVLHKRYNEYQKYRNNKPQKYSDYRALLDQKDIDIVIIGTPDHWHCTMMCDALDAGKHVYVEKPIALTMEESFVMLKAAQKSNRMIQVGQWQRSGPHYQQAIEIVRSGVLGNIRLVKVWAYQGWMKPIPIMPDSDTPEGVDYDMWLGPAPKRPFNPNRYHFNFRWFWDYAGGLMTDWGVHEIDIALYAMNAVAPKSVTASGGKFAYPDDASETPDSLQAIFEYNDFNMLWEHATGIDTGPYNRREGIAFIGNNGTLVLNREGLKVIRERECIDYSEWGDFKMEDIPYFEKTRDINYLHLHTKNFVEAIKTNDEKHLNTPIESGSVAAINAQMGNIAFKLGRKIYWNENDKSFFNDPEANALMKAKYNNGWQLPG